MGSSVPSNRFNSEFSDSVCACALFSADSGAAALHGANPALCALLELSFDELAADPDILALLMDALNDPARVACRYYARADRHLALRVEPFDGEYTAYFSQHAQFYADVCRHSDATAFQHELMYRQSAMPRFTVSAVINVSRGELEDPRSLDIPEEEMLGGLTFSGYFQYEASRVADDEDIRLYYRSVTQEYLAARFADGMPNIRLEYIRRMADGRECWVRHEAHLLEDPVSGDVKDFIYITDIDKEKRELMRLAVAAQTDSMTGLYDHENAIAHIRQYLEMEGAAGLHGLFVIDIDDFKRINDTFGHQRGDSVIVEVANTLRRLFRSVDIIGRIGGDEFIALMKNCPSRRVIVRKAAELVDSLQFICADDENSTELTCSVGVSICRADRRSFEELYSAADAALYRSKRDGKNRYTVAAGGSDTADETPASSEKESTVQLRALLEHMDAGVLVADVQNGVVKPTYVSPSYFKTIGRTEREAGAHGENLLSFVLDEDYPALYSALLDAAENDRVLDTVCRVTESGGGIGWRHLRAARLPAGSGGAHTLIGVVTDITKFQLTAIQLSDRYDRAMELRAKIDKESLGSFRLDLTANWCGDGNASDPRISAMQEGGTVDGFLERVYSTCVDESAREKLKKLFNRKALIRLFGSGQYTQSFEYKYSIEGERPQWIRTTVTMMQNPDTSNIEGLIYSRNIDRERTAKAIIDRFIRLEYEFMAFIDVKTDELTVLSISNKDTIVPPENSTLYADTLLYALPRFVVPTELEDCREAINKKTVMKYLEHSESYARSFNTVNPDGSLARKRWQFTYLDDSREVIAWTRTDITDLFLSQVDPVTGIFNRDRFYAEARRVLREYTDCPLVVARMDMDHFKAFNDLYGTAEGNRLLAQIGVAIRHLGIDAWAYGHLESDQFVFCLPLDKIDMLPTPATAARLLRARYPEFDFSVRMGIYPIDDASIDVSLMSDRAFMALRSIKGSFIEHTAYYDDSMRAELLSEQELSGDIRAALKNREFDVYLQPQYDIINGKLTGAEALVRWFHPRRGMLAPGAFIPLFEKNGSITQLDRYVWERVCELMRSWIDGGLSPVPVSVNISRMDVYNQQLSDILTELVEQYGLTPDLLRLEITESAYMEDPKQLIATVGQLRSRGFFVEMDDFGSGYSSLNTLKDVPVDLLKLDMGFISSGDDDSRGGIILSSVMRLAHWLGLPVIAEGVESEAQAEFLRGIGCSMAQGYYFARPMPIGDFEALLRSSSLGALSQRFNIAPDFDSREFWDPNSQATLVFNSFVGAVALLEYHDGVLEALRVNSQYYRATGTTPEEFELIRRSMMSCIYPADRALMLRKLDEVSFSDEDVSFDIRWSRPSRPDEPRWVGVRMRCIAKSSGRVVLYAAIEDVTERKRMLELDARRNRELRRALNTRRADDERSRLLVESLGLSVFDYDPARDLLEYQSVEDGAQSVTLVFEDYLKTLSSRGTIHRSTITGLKKALYGASLAPTRGSYDYILMEPGRGNRWRRMTYASVADDTGKVYRVVGAVTEIQEEKDREALIATLSQRLNLHTDKSPTDTIAERIFDILYEAADTNAAVRLILGVLGEYYDVSRVYIFEDSADHTRCSNTFDYHAPGIPPLETYLSDLSYKDDFYPGFLDDFDERGVFIHTDASSFQPKLRSLTERSGIRSLLQCAIYEGGVFFGFIGFADCRREREWTPEERRTLTLVSRYLGAFIMKRRRINEAVFMESISTALDDYSAYLYIVNPADYTVLYTNRAIREHSGYDFTGRLCHKEFCKLASPCEGCPVTAIREGREPRQLVIRRPSDGMWLLTNASRIQLGNKDMALVTCVDISDYMRLE